MDIKNVSIGIDFDDFKSKLGTNNNGNNGVSEILYHFINDISVENTVVLDSAFTQSVLENNNTKLTSTLLFFTKLDIPTNGNKSLSVKMVRYSCPSQYINSYSSILGKKEDGSLTVLLAGKLNNLPKVFENVTIDVSQYVSVSICYDKVDSTDNFLPTISFGNGMVKRDSVKNYIDKKHNEQSLKPISNYTSIIKNLKINIDDLQGANDDQKIDNAIALIENVGGGQIYFPSRQINITKSILLISNTKYILDNCHIQMADSIHDNIFRPKNLIVNPSQLGGICLSATWTENVEIIGIGTASVRQSIIPLRVGGQKGWRGISILFARCRNYKIDNVKIIESHMWSVSSEFSENGEFYNLEFDSTLHANADGLNFRNGCKNMYAKTITGRTTDNALATTVLDSTCGTPDAGYSYQALGWQFGDYFGAENIFVDDVRVKSKYGSALIITSSNIVKNITYKDVVSLVSSGTDWDNVSVCANQYRNFIYGSSYISGNLRNINIINSITSVHEYSLGVYGGKVDNLFVSNIVNTKIGKLGDVRNATSTIINYK